MSISFNSLQDIAAHGFDTVIDVRSPSEYTEDHLPGAINLPVLNDEERARVGTIYKQISAFEAKRLGAALVSRNAAKHLEGPLSDKDGGWRPLVYCWRGGQRSGSFTTILKQVGWRAEVVEGGYRTFRRLVAAAMHDEPLPHRVILLDGNTGTAKTDILQKLGAQDVQVVDLEGLARHRGSVFGHVAEPQPSQKGFESSLAMAFATLDPSRPVVVEAESAKIGALNIPPSLWSAMRDAPRISVSAPLSARAAYLVGRYEDISANRDRMIAILESLIPLQGRERVDHWCELARDGALETLAAELMQDHYDPRYQKWRSRGDHGGLGQIDLADLSEGSLERAAGQLAEKIKSA